MSPTAPRARGAVPARERRGRAGIRLSHTAHGREDDVLVVFETGAEAPEVELDLPVSAALLRPDGASFTVAGRDYVVAECARAGLPGFGWVVLPGEIRS